MASTTWRPIKDFPRYEVNSLGDVRSIKSKKKLQGVLKYPQSQNRQYHLTNEDGSRIVMADRLVKKHFPEMFRD